MNSWTWKSWMIYLAFMNEKVFGVLISFILLDEWLITKQTFIKLIVHDTRFDCHGKYICSNKVYCIIDSHREEGGWLLHEQRVVHLLELVISHNQFAHEKNMGIMIDNCFHGWKMKNELWRRVIALMLLNERLVLKQTIYIYHICIWINIHILCGTIVVVGVPCHSTLSWLHLH